MVLLLHDVNPEEQPVIQMPDCPQLGVLPDHPAVKLLHNGQPLQLPS